MQRYLLNIAYMGTKYNGVTKNVNLKNHISIEDVLHQAIKTIRSVDQVEIYPSSRTDSGVHATNSTFHIDLNRKLPPYVLTKKLNATFQAWNEQIRILKTTPVNNNFDSRRDAWSRTYLYRLAVTKDIHPPRKGFKSTVYKNQMFIPIEETFRCYFVLNERFEIERLKEAAKLMEGVHDFRSFMKVSKEQRTMKPQFCYRKINSIKVQPGVTLATSFNREKTLALYDFWDIEFVSKAYFYRQIRNMVGTLIAVGNGQITLRDVYEMVTIPSKHSWLYKIVPADSSALYLTNVEYLPEVLAKATSQVENEEDKNSQNTEIDDEEDLECERNENSLRNH